MKKNITRLLSSLETVIGYPDKLVNDVKLENYYKNLEINRGSLLSSYLNLSKFQDSKDKSRFNYYFWTNLTELVTEANAFYAKAFHAIGRQNFRILNFLKNIL